MLKKFLFLSFFSVIVGSIFFFFNQSKPVEAASNQTITIKTYYTSEKAHNPEDNTDWPKVVVIANNYGTADGPMDYGSCAAAGPTTYHCGTIPMYGERKIDEFDANQSEKAGNWYVHTTTTTADKLFATNGSSYFMKLSLVFHNDYYDGTTKADRNIYFYKVEFLGPDGQVFKSYTPNDTSYYPTSNGQTGAKQSFYFDMGLISATDAQNHKSTNQYGLARAFDQTELKSIVEDKSKENGKWSLQQEGAFNIDSTDIATTFQQKYSSATTSTTSLTKTCSVSLSTVNTVTGAPVQITVSGSSSRTSAEPVHLFIIKKDSGKISPAPAGTTEVFSPKAPNLLYYTYGEICTTLNKSLCLKEITINTATAKLAPGEYQVFCDLATAPNQCSGNPNCSYKGGSIDCSVGGYVQCSATDVKALTITQSLTSDINSDGTVDIYDYNLLLREYGKAGSPAFSKADIISDGRVDDTDYQKLLKDFVVHVHAN